MQLLIVLAIGVTFGAVIALIVSWLRRRDSKRIAKELLQEASTQQGQDIEIIINRIKESFGALSMDALSKSSEQFLKLAEATLSQHTEAGKGELAKKKELIDQNLETMKGDLLKLLQKVSEFEKDRDQKYGELATQLKNTAGETIRLRETTGQLREALSSAKARGQWGERMAEDVLRLLGFTEGVNYQKQKALEESSGRPDYTFLLPQGQKVHMDVKFPLSNYLRCIEAEGESDREACKNQFLKDVRARIKEVTTRNYIDPAEHTLDYMIVFIPNEQVYAFVIENDRSLLDEALNNKVILCSPLTLYAILAVIRQAVDTFSLNRTAAEILSLFGAFNKQWNNFIESLDKVGKKIADTQEEYNKLTSTRRTQLERPLRKIEDLRKQKSIPEATIPEAALIDGEVVLKEILQDR